MDNTLYFKMVFFTYILSYNTQMLISAQNQRKNLDRNQHSTKYKYDKLDKEIKMITWNLNDT